MSTDLFMYTGGVVLVDMRELELLKVERIGDLVGL